jgi:hypothetical protein
MDISQLLATFHVGQPFKENFEIIKVCVCTVPKRFGGRVLEQKKLQHKRLTASAKRANYFTARSIRTRQGRLLQPSFGVFVN